MGDTQKTKVIKLKHDTIAYIEIESDRATIGSSPDNRIISDGKTGNYIVGKTIFTTHPENIKMGGVFQINGLNTSTMASTIVTPIPMFTFSFPMENTLDFLNETLQDILGLI